jgi:hypothetical protein
MALELASQTLALAMAYNDVELLAGGPCRLLFEVARQNIDLLYMDGVGTRVVERAVSNGEYSTADLGQYVDEVLEEMSEEGY